MRHGRRIKVYGDVMRRRKEGYGPSVFVSVLRRERRELDFTCLSGRGSAQPRGFGRELVCCESGKN